MTNLEIARLLRKVAAAYTVLGENFFKIQAYEKAADSIEHATSEVKDLFEAGRLDTLPGVGEHIRNYLVELFEKGKVGHFDKVMGKLPKGMFEILGIPGIGPKTAYKIAKELGISSVSDLKEAVTAGKLAKIPGLGEKTAQEILKGIEEVAKREGRMILPYAWNLAYEIVSILKKSSAILEAYPLGSLRRMVATVGDIDIAASTNNPAQAINFFIGLPQVERVIGKGEHKATVVLKNGRQVDFMVTTPDRFGALLQHFTGSKMHNIHLRKIANEKGLSLSEYGISKIHQKGDQFSADLLAKCKTEEEFYKILGMDYIPPELREDTGEIEAAINHQLPRLVELDDIKGDLHVHSSFDIETSHDLGENSLEELGQKAHELGYQYIAIADHNPSVAGHTSAQIERLLARRLKLIEQINPSRGIKLLNSLEVDILADGTLAIPDQILSDLDLVVASVHSSFNQDLGTMTKRVLKALENPNVDILGHPTGRLIGSREGYEVDWRKVFNVCKKNHKALEVNAWPERLDLPDILVKEATGNGVKLVISTDAHAQDQMDNMRFGVSVARRGWARQADILNCLSWIDFSKYFRIQSR
jgi:DNA polymerase (family 10)